MRNLDKMNNLLQELSHVVDLKCGHVTMVKLKNLMDITKYEENDQFIIDCMVRKLEYEQDQDNFAGLANGIKLTLEYEQMRDEVA